MTKKKLPDNNTQDGVSRRGLIGGAALAVGAGTLATHSMLPAAPVRADTEANRIEPGDLDEYYGFGLAGNPVRFGLSVYRQCAR